MNVRNQKKLNILMGGVRIGVLTQDPNGRLHIRYDTRWLAAGEHAFPISMSLPLEAVEHSGAVVEHYLWNLLPDNHDTLKAWGAEYGVSYRSAFELLSAVGDDCPGAIQFVSDEWIERSEGMDPTAGTPIDDTEIASRLRQLREDRTWTGRKAGDVGRFSLPGAQPKMALAYDGRRWIIPAGRNPTTHIFKPPIPDLKGTNENEFACLQLASSLGLKTAKSQVLRFGDETAIVVTRYDRELIEDRAVGAYYRRIHQEDMCQALGVHPDRKYQKDGGPGPEQILDDVLQHTVRMDDAKSEFLKALIFNYLIGGTDAHAKNYSIVHFGGSRSDIAPLYDLMSYWPYLEKGGLRKLKMAMRISNHYEFEDVCPRHWDDLAEHAGLDADLVRDLMVSMAAEMPDSMNDVRKQAYDQGVGHDVITRMTDMIAERCAKAFRLLEADPRPAPNIGDQSGGVKFEP